MITTISPIKSHENFEDNIEKLDFEVSTCFIEFKKTFLILKRGRKDEQFGLWGVPGGKLNNGENPRSALERELKEELGLSFCKSNFIFLSKALSFNRYDGRYLLHMYYYSLNLKPQISINPQEHTAFSWVSLQEFETLDLLISQGKAFKIIKNTLIDLLDKNNLS